jgi:hypothetical protein
MIQREGAAPHGALFSAVQAKLAELSHRSCLPQSGGTRVTLAQLTLSPAAPDPAAVELLTSRPQLQHLQFSVEAKDMTVSQVTVLGGWSLAGMRCCAAHHAVA